MKIYQYNKSSMKLYFLRSNDILGGVGKKNYNKSVFPFTIKGFFPLTTLSSIDNNSTLINVNETIFEGLFVLLCILVALVFLSIFFMENNPNLTNKSTISSRTSRSYWDRNKISGKLLSQLLHNNDHPHEKLDYRNFPVGHSGHLDEQSRMRLVSILRSSPIADHYRYGSSIGNMYLRGTNTHPNVSPEMIGVVLAVEYPPV
jgi:hypothetical protein